MRPLLSVPGAWPGHALTAAGLQWPAGWQGRERNIVYGTNGRLGPASIGASALLTCTSSLPKAPQGGSEGPHWLSAPLPAMWDALCATWFTSLFVHLFRCCPESFSLSMPLHPALTKAGCSAEGKTWACQRRNLYCPLLYTIYTTRAHAKAYIASFTARQPLTAACIYTPAVTLLLQSPAFPCHTMRTPRQTTRAHPDYAHAGYLLAPSQPPASTSPCGVDQGPESLATKKGAHRKVARRRTV